MTYWLSESQLPRALRTPPIRERRQTCHLRERATYAPAELGGEIHNVSREIEPARRSFRRRRSCTSREVARLAPSRLGRPLMYVSSRERDNKKLHWRPATPLSETQRLLPSSVGRADDERVLEYVSTGSGLLRKSTGANAFPRKPAGSLLCSYRNLRKSPEASGSLREKVI